MDDIEEENPFTGKDEISASEDEDGQEKHEKLLDAMAQLDGKKRKRKDLRIEPSVQVSEFNLATAAGNNQVDVNELVGALKNTGRQVELRKKIKSAKNKKVLPTPLNKLQNEEVQRTIAYEKTQKEVSKWLPIVKKNREAEQLHFPLEKSGIKLITTGEMVKKFQPRTPLELEVAKMLHGSDHVLEDTKMLTKAEERALRAMDLEEAKARRAELQKHRALLSYKEAKARRQNKIKSKKYHRVLRKEQLKKGRKALEELKESDPQSYAEKIMQVEKERIQERMSLKHKGGSKYMTQQMAYGKYNKEARDNVQTMLQKNKELTQKLALASDSEEEEDVKKPEEVAPKTNKDGKVMYSPWTGSSISGSNPWMEPIKEKIPTAYQRPQAVVNREAKNPFDSGVISDAEDETVKLPKKNFETTCNSSGLGSEDLNEPGNDDSEGSSDSDCDVGSDFDLEKGLDNSESGLLAAVENLATESDSDVEMFEKQKMGSLNTIDDHTTSSREANVKRAELKGKKRTVQGKGGEGSEEKQMKCKGKGLKVEKGPKHKLGKSEKKKVTKEKVKVSDSDAESSGEEFGSDFDFDNGKIDPEKGLQAAIDNLVTSGSDSDAESDEPDVNIDELFEELEKKERVVTRKKIGSVEKCKKKSPKSERKKEGENCTNGKSKKGRNGKGQKLIDDDEMSGDESDQAKMETLDPIDSGDEQIMGSSVRKQTMESLEEEWSEDENVTEPKRLKADTSNKGSDEIVPKRRDISIDPKKVLTVETKVKNMITSNVVSDEEEDEESQRMTISEAFVDDDVLDEFTKEKKEIVDRNKPKDLDLTLPGWGAWGGEGVQVSKRKRKRFTVKSAPARPRKDRSLDNVILSEMKDNSIAKHQVSDLPYGFSNVKQFESSIRAPIGKTWNPETSFKELTKPKVLTRPGQIIKPMDESEKYQKQKEMKNPLAGIKSTEGRKKGGKKHGHSKKKK